MDSTRSFTRRSTRRSARVGSDSFPKPLQGFSKPPAANQFKAGKKNAVDKLPLKEGHFYLDYPRIMTGHNGKKGAKRAICFRIVSVCQPIEILRLFAGENFGPILIDHIRHITIWTQGTRRAPATRHAQNRRILGFVTLTRDTRRPTLLGALLR
jgi:hypothetical protein